MQFFAENFAEFSRNAFGIGVVEIQSVFFFRTRNSVGDDINFIKLIANKIIFVGAKMNGSVVSGIFFIRALSKRGFAFNVSY